MINYELHHTLDRQSELLAEVERNKWASERNSARPSLTHNLVLSTGQALESAGNWLKRQASPTYRASNKGQGVPVPVRINSFK
jgi:hypothetical protein